MLALAWIGSAKSVRRPQPPPSAPGRKSASLWRRQFEFRGSDLRRNDRRRRSHRLGRRRAHARIRIIDPRARRYERGQSRRRSCVCNRFTRGLRIAIGSKIPWTPVASLSIVAAIPLVAVLIRTIGSGTTVLKSVALTILPGGKVPRSPPGRSPSYAAGRRRTAVGRSAQQSVVAEIPAAPAAGKRLAAPRAKQNDPTARQNRRHRPGRFHPRRAGVADRFAPAPGPPARRAISR